MSKFRPVYRLLLIVIALMSGPFSLVREVLQFTDPVKYPDKPLFIACLLGACMVAMALLWRDENQAKKNAERTLNNERPQLGINAHSTEGQEMWRQSPVPVTFTIQHISGRVPTTISFDPVLSKQGRFSLVFSPLPFANRPPHPTPMNFEVIEIGVPQLSASDWEATRPHQKDLLGMFLDDSPMELVELDYGLSAHFLDGTDPRGQWFTLSFDKQRWRFSVASLSR